MDQNIRSSFSSSSSFNCELTIIGAKNIDIRPKRVVFVRCYLHADSSTRIKLDTKAIPSKSHSITWNQTFSLDCVGNQDSVQQLRQRALVFELRWRSVTASFIGRVKGSTLIGRAEVPWQNIMGANNMEVRKWIAMTPENGLVCNDIIDSTSLYVGVKLQECRENVNRGRWDEKCGCVDDGCNSCLDYEFFTIEAALEAM